MKKEPIFDEEEQTPEENGHADYCTYCPECGAMFFQGEEGFDWSECYDCGSEDVYETPA